MKSCVHEAGRRSGVNGNICSYLSYRKVLIIRQYNVLVGILRRKEALAEIAWRLACADKTVKSENGSMVSSSHPFLEPFHDLGQASATYHERHEGLSATYKFIRCHLRLVMPRFTVFLRRQPHRFQLGITHDFRV